MERKICIITGANAGIGKAAAIKLVQEGCHVIMGCRNNVRGKAALEEIKKSFPDSSIDLELLDMGSASSIKSFSVRVLEKYKRVDILIHNAAIFNITQKEPEFTEEGFEAVWSINHLGPVLLTDMLLPRLEKSRDARIITISSQGLMAMPFLKVDLKDPEFKKRKFSIVKAYYQSKRAQVIYTYWLAEKLKELSISVNSIRVPAVQVDLSRHPEVKGFKKWVYEQKAKKSITPEEMADTYAYLALSSDIKGITGKYFNEKNREVKSNSYTYKKDNIEAVMNLTQSYLERLK